MNRDADSFFIGILIGTQEFFLPRQGDLIAFNPVHSSENITNTFRALPLANPIWIIVLVLVIN